MKLKLLIWLNAENWCQNDFTLENCIRVESIRGGSEDRGKDWKVHESFLSS